MDLYLRRSFDGIVTGKSHVGNGQSDATEALGDVRRKNADGTPTAKAADLALNFLEQITDDDSGSFCLVRGIYRGLEENPECAEALQRMGSSEVTDF